MKRICLVTSTLIGPTRNGGVGTAFAYLAEELAKNDFEVTLLFNGFIQYESEKYWHERYKELGIEFIYLQRWVEDNVFQSTVSDSNWWLWRSYWTYQFVLKNEYDLLHFSDTCGYAFHTIQAKRTTKEFDNTKIVVTMHSSTEWLKSGMDEYHLEIGSEDRANHLYLQLNYAERYSCQYCDFLLAPSKAIMDWSIERGWILCENREVVFNAYCLSIQGVSEKEINKNHFVFFGRLEKQKGLDKFIKAINKLHEENEELEVSFLGRESKVDGLPAAAYIKKNIAPEVKYSIHTDFDTFQALSYIKEEGAICVLPSKTDNSPYGIVECIENKIPFICSRTGGIPELVDERVLFDFDEESIYDKMGYIQNVDYLTLNHKYSYKEANKRIVDIHKKIIERKNDVEIVNTDEKVSVCVAYKRQSVFVYDLVSSIIENDYRNIEIIIAAETSYDKELIEKINDRGLDIKYVDNTIRSRGAAFNSAANVADGEYLVFIDAENQVSKNYISSMIYGLKKSGVDAISSHYRYIYGVGNMNLSSGIKNLACIPQGMNKELALFENCYSSASFMIKKDIFDKLGGFTENNISTTLWEFFNRFIISGYNLEIIPKSIFRERDIAVELMDEICYPRVIGYESHNEAIEPLLKEIPSFWRYIIYEWMLGRNYEEVLSKRNRSRFLFQGTRAKNFIGISEHKDIVNGLNKRIKELEKQNDINLNKVISSYENAFFWKLSKPLRKIMDHMKGR